jgi:hypothetical protein
MGFRLRKSIKILPGVKLNVSPTGTSWTIGKRGASVNLKDGTTRASVGIPGTGVSYSEKIGGSSRATSTPGASLFSFLCSLITLAGFIFFIWAVIVYGGVS